MDQIWEKIDFLIKANEFYLREYKEFLDEFHTLILFGAGRDGKKVLDFLAEFIPKKEIFFVDNDASKYGVDIHRGIYCYEKERIFQCDANNTIVIIASTRYMDSIYHELQGYHNRIPSNNMFIDRQLLEKIYYYSPDAYKKIFAAFSLLADEPSRHIFYQRLLRSQLSGVYFGMADLKTDPQYFPPEFVRRLGEYEVFLDCGAYIGDTIETFREQTGDVFQAIYSFEMDKHNFEALSKSPCVKDSRIHLIQAGVSNQTAVVNYKSSGVESSYYFARVGNHELQADGIVLPTAKTVSIDDLVSNGTIKEKATFIKMDIEGAELDALHGMENLMRCEKPKLAICVYHKPEDLWEIPLYIHSILPQYNIFLRHHSISHDETVLYAYIE